jgi:hypothetical protein
MNLPIFPIRTPRGLSSCRAANLHHSFSPVVRTATAEIPREPRAFLPAYGSILPESVRLSRTQHGRSPATVTPGPGVPWPFMPVADRFADGSVVGFCSARPHGPWGAGRANGVDAAGRYASRDACHPPPVPRWGKRGEKRERLPAVTLWPPTGVEEPQGRGHGMAHCPLSYPAEPHREAVPSPI